LRDKYPSLDRPLSYESNPDLIGKIVDYLFDRVKKILGQLRAAEHIFFFFDYDGTLTPIVRHPGKANLSEELKGLLLAFKTNPKFLLAIVSGRPLKDIHHRVGLEEIYYVGNHGLEVFEPGRGIKHLFQEKVVPELRRIRDRLNNQLKDMDGLLIEDKGCILSIHYRNVDPKWVPALPMTLKKEMKDSLVPLCLKRGKKVFEVWPQSSINKGTAVLDLLGRTEFDRVLPLYIGDDRTDEDAFRALQRRGITIFVGLADDSSAQYYVKDPSEVHQFLKLIQEEFG
jgi:trehalose-phosphatase